MNKDRSTRPVRARPERETPHNRAHWWCSSKVTVVDARRRHHRAQCLGDLVVQF
jgi:hypothetical protein